MRATFPIVVVLPTPFTPTKSQTFVCTLLEYERPCSPAESSDTRRSSFKRVEHGVGALQLPRANPAISDRRSAQSWSSPDIGPEQCLFEIVPGRFVDRAPRP